MKHGRSDYDRIQDPGGSIPVDEPVFLIRAQDTTASEVVNFWADCAEGIGADPEIVSLARKQAKEMRKWANARHCKVPDLSDIHHEQVFSVRTQDSGQAPCFCLDYAIEVEKTQGDATIRVRVESDDRLDKLENVALRVLSKLETDEGRCKVSNSPQPLDSQPQT